MTGLGARLLALLGALVVLLPRAAVADAPDTAGSEPIVEVEAVEVVEVIQATCTKPCDDPAADEEVEEVEVVEVIQPVAAAVAADPVEVVEEVEVVEQVEVVEAVVATETAAAQDWSVTQVTGRFHPAFVHLPIGFLLLLLVLEVLAVLRRNPALAACGLAAHVLTALAAVPAVVSGFLRSAEMWSAVEPPELLIDHRSVMLVVSGLVVLSLVLRLARRNELDGALRWVYLLLLAAAAIAVGYGGHLGGQLVYGEQHLPF